MHDGERFLAQAVASIGAQTYRRFEVIAVDDGSSDGSAELLRRVPWITVLTQENRGVTAARNRAIGASAGALVAFLDQDDRWRPDALARHVAAHAAHPQVGYTLSHQVCFLEQGAPVPGWLGAQRLGEPVAGYLPGAIVVKRRTFETIGLFDPAYRISSDADWFARAKDAGVGMLLLPEVTLERRIHEGNQSRRVAQIQRELLRLLRRSSGRKSGNG